MPSTLPPAEVSPDAYDRLDVWLDAPELGYASWLAGHTLGKQSKTVYLSMWAKFARWMKAQGIALAQCESHHISNFLDAHGLVREHRHRYVRLIERTYTHLAALGLDTPNPGRQAKFDRVGSGDNEPTRFLSAGEQTRFLVVLRHRFAESGEGQGTLEWTDVRDAAIAGVMIGGGLKVREAIALPVNCTYRGEQLVVPATANTRAHTAKLFLIACEGLDAWASAQSSVPFKRERLFPAALDRRRNDQRTKTSAMHPATVFRRLDRLFEEAGISGERATGQTLRNTYAAQLIEANAGDDVLTECLGFAAPFSAPRLRQQHAAWKAVEAQERKPA